MSMSIGAAEGVIAPNVLLVPELEQAEAVASHWLQNPVCYSAVRNMKGYTGTYKGASISVQTVGIGVASAAIYCSELAQSYQASRMVYLSEAFPLGQTKGLVLAEAAHTTSSMNRLLFDGRIFAGVADWNMLYRAEQLAHIEELPVQVGACVTVETLPDVERLDLFEQRETLCADTATSALYLCAGRFGLHMLAMLWCGEWEASCRDRMECLALNLLAGGE